MVIVGPSEPANNCLKYARGMDTCTSGSIYLDGKEIGDLQKKKALYRRQRYWLCSPVLQSSS